MWHGPLSRYVSLVLHQPHTLNIRGIGIIIIPVLLFLMSIRLHFNHRNRDLGTILKDIFRFLQDVRYIFKKDIYHFKLVKLSAESLKTIISSYTFLPVMSQGGSYLNSSLLRTNSRNARSSQSILICTTDIAPACFPSSLQRN